MDVEAETDRKYLCEKILTAIDVAQVKAAMSTTAPVIQPQPV